jgi:hypothetical protein
MKIYTFNAPLWRYTAETASWYFLSIKKELADEIKKVKPRKKGWGQVKVEVTIGKTIWQTSLFPGKMGTYMLAIKKEVRLKEKIAEGDEVEVKITLL